MDRRTVVLPLLALASLCSATMGLAQQGPVVDATLDSMRGGRCTLSAERGRRIVVLFYEDRPHIEDNEQLKGNLNRFIAGNQLAERVVVYGVANLGDLGDAAPRDLVRRMISPLLDRWGVEILLDWDGVMRRSPFSFETNSANVGIVDRQGRLVWRHTGALDPTRTTEFYRVLRRVLREG